MKGRTKAQEARLLIDKLEKAAVDAKGVVVGLPEVKGKQGDLIPKTPDGIRTLIGVLHKAYEVTRDEQNAPTVEELHSLTVLEPAKKAVEEARTALEQAELAYQEAMKEHTHRIRLEDPEIDETSGLAKYPTKPTCLVCGDPLEDEWFCIASPDLRCSYPNVLRKGTEALIRGSDLAAAKHDGDIECVHCGETWMRLE